MYNFDEVIDRQGTNCVQLDALDMIYQHKDLLPFWIADMDIMTPQPIIDKMNERMQHKVFGYTKWQCDCFYNAITHWFKTRFDTQLYKQDIHYAPSVLFTVTEVIRQLTNKGDGVILNTPSYNNFINLIQGNERMIIENELVEEEDGYEMDFVQFEYLCSMPQNKVFILCNPHNPTGKVYRENELKKIIEICRKHDVFIISDEIHMDFVRHGKHVTLAKLMEQDDKILVTTCLGKTFNISGIPHSYFITKNRYMTERLNAVMTSVYGMPGVNILALEAIKAAYNDCADWVDALNEHIERNMNISEQYIQTHLSEYVEFRKPDATFLAWIDFKKSGFNETEVQDAFQNKGKIATGIGSLYELSESTHFRFNIACSEEKLMKGLEAIKVSFESLKNSHQ